ncbi:MAG: YbhB/YbcL family Raf kinase inhibitor-like protein [Gammaproteobacteria bacterium]|nr:MAG: YbhB/YbcL family Raf kinase inhibitor-like protein [Gammaproteobacteria bacterium]
MGVLLMALSTVSSAGGMTLSSPDVHEGQRVAEAFVYNGFGCTGGNLSPALTWSGEPGGTQSFAVTVFDPDAPTGHGWWHWLIYDIPADVHSLPRGAGDPSSGLAPAGSHQGMTDFKTTGYGGPCPPVGHGTHRYVFTVHALDVPRLGLPEGTPPGELARAIAAHELNSASITAVYSR